MPIQVNQTSIVNVPAPQNVQGGLGTMVVRVISTLGQRPSLQEEVFTVPGGPFLGRPYLGWISFEMNIAGGLSWSEPQYFVLSNQFVQSPQAFLLVPRIIVWIPKWVTTSIDFQVVSDQ